MLAHLTKPLGLGVLLLAAISLVGPPAQAANVTINLCAKTGSITLPDATVVPIWGFVNKDPLLSCSDPLHPAGQLPGPVIRVTVSDVVTVRVHNQLSVPTSILIPGQVVRPVLPFSGPLGTFTHEVLPGANGRYRFTAKTGTYLYESGTDPDRQVAMGLHGALIVASAVPNQAYSQAGTGFDTEAVLVLGEIDPALHANPGGFNMQNYAPKYALINGKAYPDTTPVPVSAGQNVLLRYLNPSFTHHAMALLGLHQRVIAKEAFELPTVVSVVAETIPAGTTADMITTIPATAGPVTFYPVYNRNMRLTNASANTPGGMQTELEVRPLYFSTAGDGTVPGVSNPDDADIYKWNGRRFRRVFDATAAGLAAGANLSGLKVVDEDTFYASFAGGATLPGLGAVTATDIVLFDAGTWSLFFNGTLAGLLPGGDLDIDAFDIDATGIIYFSTLGPGVVPVVSGPYDDADIYSWDGASFARVFTASTAGLPADANVDGLQVVDADTFYMSFSLDAGILVTGITDPVQDEDVVLYDAGVWSLFFDGSTYGLGADNAQDIDAMALP